MLLVPLLNTNNFIDNLIDNLDKFNIDDNNHIFYNIWTILSDVELTNEQSKKIVEKLLETNYNFKGFRVESFINIIAENNLELQTEILRKYIKHDQACYSCIIYCLNNECHKNIVYENIDNILKNKNIDLFILKYQVNDNYNDNDNIKEEMINKIKQKIDENSKDNIKAIIKNLYSSLAQINVYLKNLNETDNKKLDNILDIITLLVEDICKNENINMSDVNIIGNGAFSYVLEIGNEVLKVGRKRGTKTFPNNPYIIAPLLRKEFSINNKLEIQVEVTEKADTKSPISEEELYQLYKKIRNLGLYWSDVHLTNVGRLLKDNIPYWREELPLTDERLGLSKYTGSTILKKGEIIIIDNDFISESKIPGRPMTEIEKKFEKRYQNELENLNNIQINGFISENISYNDKKNIEENLNSSNKKR